MIGAYVNRDRGSTQVIGFDVPNGPATIERLIDGRAPYLLRGGSFTVEDGGFSKEDAEVPFGVPLTYRVSVAPPDRLVQRNTVLTPTFGYGVKGWRAGAGRTLTVVPGTDGASPLVGAVSANVPGSSPVYEAPAVIGAVSTPAGGVAGNIYTLTPTGSVALGDWLYLIHHQAVSGYLPSVPGFQQVFTGEGGNVAVSVWRRKRVAGDTGVTVTTPGTVGSKAATLVWVRGASDSFVPTVGPSAFREGAVALPLGTVPMVSRPSVLLTVLAATFPTGTTGHTETIAPTGQTFTADAGVRHTTVGVFNMADTGLAPRMTASFPTPATAALGVQIAVPSDAPVTQRVIATTPVAAMRKTGNKARVTGRVKFTTEDLWLWQDAKEAGTWQQVRDSKGTWGAVRSASSAAGDDYMRLFVDLVYQYSNTTTVPGTSAAWNAWVAGFTGPNRQPLDNVIISAMYVIRTGTTTPSVEADLVSQRNQLIPLLQDIHTTPTRSAYLLSGAIPLTSAGQPVDLIDDELAIAVIACDVLGLALTAPETTVPVGSVITQTYVAPQQVIVADAARTGQWVDFSFLFTLPASVPNGAVLRFMHGTNVREYAVRWQFDRIGITEGDFMANRSPLYWFAGDTTVPAQPEDYLLPDGIWTDQAGDSRIVWTGTPGESVSEFYGPSRVYTDAATQIDAPPKPAGYDQPVFLNDPIAPARGGWYDLLRISDLSYPARRALLDVLGRGPQIAVSSTRGWATGQFTLLTRTMAQRALLLNTLQTGRILLFRSPDPRYPEDTWYISVGDVTEQRTGGDEGDQRRAERLWMIPFAQVERPVGLIDQAAGRTWGQVRDEWTNWEGVRRDNDTWLELLYPTKVNVPPVLQDPLFPGSPNAYPGLATFPSGGA